MILPQTPSQASAICIWTRGAAFVFGSRWFFFFFSLLWISLAAHWTWTSYQWRSLTVTSGDNTAASVLLRSFNCWVLLAGLVWYAWGNSLGYEESQQWERLYCRVLLQLRYVTWQHPTLREVFLKVFSWQYLGYGRPRSCGVSLETRSTAPVVEFHHCCLAGQYEAQYRHDSGVDCL